jgi:hypothetical protein
MRVAAKAVTRYLKGYKMGQGKFFDKPGFFLAGLTLVISLSLFYSNTQEFAGSFTAAIMTAALVWATYIILKWLLLANRN